MVIDREYGSEWSGWFAILVANIFLRRYYLQYTSFLSLNAIESVIVSAVIRFQVLGK